jgi:diguanylate cyclase (GGDEF)-like protein
VVAPSYRVGRIAWIGLVVTVLAIAFVIMMAGINTRRSIRSVAESSALAGAYIAVDDAMSAGMEVVREYRVAPDPALRGRFADGKAALLVALTEIQHDGTPEDRDLAVRIRAAFGPYEQAVLRMFDAVDAHDEAQIQYLEREELNPTYVQIDRLIDDGADRHADTVETAMDRLYRTQTVVLYITAGGIVFGLSIMAGFIVMLVRYQRRIVRNANESQHQATHDTLTGLPNRALFADRVGQALAASRRTGARHAVMLLDLDRFKEVNDTLGHRYGDDLLRNVAERLTAVLRDSDTVARLSGDEFAVLLPGVGADDARELADRMLRELHQSFLLGDLTVDIEISIGVAIAPEHGDEVEEVMRNADLAMYAAKDAKTGIVMYDPSTLVHQPKRLLLLGELRRALSQPGELVLHYQPKVDLHLSELIGVEALVRWNHPQRGSVSPGEFIPIAESTGLINKLTVHVLDLALAQVRGWLDEGREIPVAVNLSPRCLLDTEMLDRIRDMLVRHRVPARLLRLEVTETAVMANPALALETLTGLHDLGIRLSIDDYGTGYSSMAYLRRLPVDELKVDRSFVLNMTSSDNDAILVRSAIDLGHNLGLSVVAEGVEGADHVTALRELGCDIAQGYHFARPMPPADLAEWLNSTQHPVRDTAVPSR